MAVFDAELDAIRADFPKLRGFRIPFHGKKTAVPTQPWKYMHAVK